MQNIDIVWDIVCYITQFRCRFFPYIYALNYSLNFDASPHCCIVIFGVYSVIIFD